jgi:protein-S-isoprenylcysteine O-methyltransferase Ste14
MVVKKYTGAIMTQGFWIILAATAVYGIVHSFLATHAVKNFVARLFGKGFFARFYRFMFSLFGGITLLPILALMVLLPDELIYLIPSPWVILTGAIQLVAGGCFMAALVQTGFTDFLGLRRVLLDEQAAIESLELDELVVTGMYRWVRHPLYFFGLVVMWLMPVMTWNTLALFIGATGYMLIGSWFEERRLIEQFGDAYRRYQRRTPWMLPRIWEKLPGFRNKPYSQN